MKLAEELQRGIDRAQPVDDCRMNAISGSDSKTFLELLKLTDGGIGSCRGPTEQP